MSTIAAELRIQTHAKRLRLPLIGAQAARYADEAATAGHGHLSSWPPSWTPRWPRGRSTWSGRGSPRLTSRN